MVHCAKRSFIDCTLLILIVLLVGGDWNHGILNDFPIILGMA
jgi:hypothetical protein